MPVGLMPRVRHGHHFLKKRTCCVFQWSGSRRRFLRGFPGSKTLACPIGCVPDSEVREAFLRDALALSKRDLPPETRSFARVLRRRSRLLSGSYALGIVIGVASLSSVAIAG